MIAKSLFSIDTPVISFNSSVEEALLLMSSSFLDQLPLIDEDGKCQGILTEDELLNHNEKDQLVNLKLELIKVFSNENEHVLELIERMGAYKLTVIPLINSDEGFVGSITLKDIFIFLSSQYTFSDSGGILVIETNRSDYTLSDLARIVESEGAHIIGSYLSSLENSSNILVTLKISILDLGRIIATLERYGYTIRASFNKEGYFNVLKDRYESLMSFLNV